MTINNKINIYLGKKHEKVTIIFLDTPTTVCIFIRKTAVAEWTQMVNSMCLQITLLGTLCSPISFFLGNMPPLCPVCMKYTRNLAGERTKLLKAKA